MMDLLSDSLYKWNSLDKQAGKDMMLNGQRLEDLVAHFSSIPMCIIRKRLAKTPAEIKIHRNVRWEGIDGEVDIVLTDIT